MSYRVREVQYALSPKVLRSMLKPTPEPALRAPCCHYTTTLQHGNAPRLGCARPGRLN